jgi:hypothetical protein
VGFDKDEHYCYYIAQNEEEGLEEEKKDRITSEDG